MGRRTAKQIYDRDQYYRDIITDLNKENRILKEQVKLLQELCEKLLNYYQKGMTIKEALAICAEHEIEEIDKRN